MAPDNTVRENPLNLVATCKGFFQQALHFMGTNLLSTLTVFLAFIMQFNEHILSIPSSLPDAGGGGGASVPISLFLKTVEILFNECYRNRLKNTKQF